MKTDDVEIHSARGKMDGESARPEKEDDDKTKLKLETSPSPHMHPEIQSGSSHRGHFHKMSSIPDSLQDRAKNSVMDIWDHLTIGQK